MTPRADVYALACVLYECLTGEAPYRADNTGVLITSHMMEPAPRPSTEGLGVPQAFDAVIERGMAKNPDDPLRERRRSGCRRPRGAEQPGPGPGRHPSCDTAKAR